MADTLFISEFSDLPITSNGVLQAANAEAWVTDQHVTLSATSAPSAAFNAQTTYIIIITDTSCSIAWTAEGAGSVNPATTGNLLLPANVPMLFGVAGGMKISGILNS